MIDLRSDTVTIPTEQMREAMAKAEVGDDVYEDDPTTRRLEALAAETMGKEAALFVPSGTMGNQLAVMGHTKPTDEIILSRNSHIVASEAGGAALLSGVNLRVVDHPRDYVLAEDVHANVRTSNIHHPDTALVCLENALGNGRVVPISIMQQTYEAAKQHGLAVHLDGARIFNAAAALGVHVRDIAIHTDTLMFCVSKGLCAPVGSLLCGSGEFIRGARRRRKLLGGGMRQVGILAAAGIIAIEEMSKRLLEDHLNAKTLAEGLRGMDGIEIQEEHPQINMVFFRITRPGFNHQGFVAALLQHGIRINPPSGDVYRFVTHNGITHHHIQQCIEIIGEAI